MLNDSDTVFFLFLFFFRNVKQKETKNQKESNDNTRIYTFITQISKKENE